MPVIVDEKAYGGLMDISRPASEFYAEQIAKAKIESRCWYCEKPLPCELHDTRSAVGDESRRGFRSARGVLSSD